MKTKANHLFFALLLTSMLYACTNCPPPPDPYTLTQSYIDPVVAVEYQDNFHAYVDNNKLADTTNNVWFSLDQLQNYIIYAKHVADSLKLEVSGVRIYFGRYDSSPTASPIQQTVFLVPTFPSQTGTAVPGNDKDIPEIKVLNYGSAGDPPKKKYPY